MRGSGGECCREIARTARYRSQSGSLRPVSCLGGGLVSFLKDFVPHQWDRLVPHGAIFSHFRRVI